MYYDYHRNHGCHGCGGSSKPSRRRCSCPPYPYSSRQNNCNALGPFLAIDAACIIPPPNTGSIIPFSSGITPVVLTSIAGGLVGTTSLIGFGTAIPGVTLAGTTIDLTGVATEAFSVPRAGNITAISATFTTLAALDLLGTNATINAQVYRAPADSNIFTATGATVNLTPPLTGTLALGAIASGSANVPPVPVAQGDRLLMVFSVTATGVTLVLTVTGTANAGITIS